MQKTLGGIQQVGVGIPNVHEAWKWYRENFGLDIRALDDEGTAELMLPYTDEKPQKRHAILALNLKGGGGLEVWQYTGRVPQKADFDIVLGDLGIFAAKIKTDNIEKTFSHFSKLNCNLSEQIFEDIEGKKHFFVKDPYDNVFQIIESDDWFSDMEVSTGGICGAILGVSDMDRALHFYKNVIGLDKVVYDTNGKFDDFAGLSGGDDTFRRVVITHSQKFTNAFSNLYGNGFVELVESQTRHVNKIFANRLWGDLGFIHLCFDVTNMHEWDTFCSSEGFPFTTDSRQGGDTFDMGDAAGSFAYIEDPDGTLIELVEAHKVPVVQRLSWNINLRNRNSPLPDWIVKMLRFKRYKE